MEIRNTSQINRSLLDSVSRGEKLCLRDGVYQQVKLREWKFAGLEGGDRILLAYEGYGYLWEAKIDDIDWDEYRINKMR
jgi:hypothetical protein